MTFLALVLGMGTDQGITGFLLMIKGLGRLPFFRRMAKTAFVLFEFPLVKMHIIFHMALVAGIHQTHVADFALASRLIRAFCGVALFTISFSMRSIQLKTGLAVVKGLGIDIGRIKVPAFMILMTINAVLVAHQPMKVLLRFHILANFLVAFEAIFIGNATRRLMALQTVIMRMFQLIMANDQRSRSQELVEEAFKFHLRILRRGRGCSQKEKGYDESELSHLTFPQIVPVWFSATRPRSQTCSQT